MMRIPCPWCGPRNANEFHHLGEVTTRPDPDSATPEEWRAYLYLRTNPADWVTERWFHRAGCRRFLVVERHTVTNEILQARRPGAGA